MSSTVELTESFQEISYLALVEYKNVLDREIIRKSRESLNISKLLEKKYKKDVKDARKNKRKKNSNKDKEPSGFNKPSRVPEEFHIQPWGCDPNELLPRTVLTKMVYDYIKNNNLKNEADRRIINTNETIRRLFHLLKDEVLQFKNFQTYMARLYNRDNLPDYVEETVVVEKKTKKKKAKGKGKKKNKSLTV